MTRQEQARTLRADPERHYNCAQAVVIPFAEELGLDHETAFRLAAHFGAGMRRGAACGAATGGLMALGLLGLTDEETARAFNRRFLDRAGAMDCQPLVEAAQARGEEKRPYCDGLVELAVSLVEELSSR